MKKNPYLLPISITLVLLFLDQWIKIYIKNHFFIGEEIAVIGSWFRIHFTENYGMAFGIEFGGKSGKILLTLFRILAVGVIGWFITTLIKKQAHLGYIISWTLIFTGALGNIIDSVFYGRWFGYDELFHGRVVDMFYFPIIQTTVPEWFPIWKGEDFEFFRPVFNLADACISIGFVIILLFQKKFISSTETENTIPNEEQRLTESNQHEI